jgi:hypothetical protein
MLCFNVLIVLVLQTAIRKAYDNIGGLTAIPRECLLLQGFRCAA